MGVFTAMLPGPLTGGLSTKADMGGGVRSVGTAIEMGPDLPPALRGTRERSSPQELQRTVPIGL
jgi:hypothetical protein